MRIKSLAIALAAVAGPALVTAAASTVEASDPWGVNIRLGGSTLHVGHGGHYAGGHPGGYLHGGRPLATHRGFRGHYDWHDTSHYDWHDTSHYDYLPGGYRRHGNHYHYVPGQWRLHRDGHYDFHSDGHFDYHRGGHHGGYSHFRH